MCVSIKWAGEIRARNGLNKSVDCSSTHRKLSRADGLFRVSLDSGSMLLLQ